MTSCWQQFSRDPTDRERRRDEPYFAKLFICSCSLADAPTAGLATDAVAAWDRNFASATASRILLHHNWRHLMQISSTAQLKKLLLCCTGNNTHPTTFWIYLRMQACTTWRNNILIFLQSNFAFARFISFLIGLLLQCCLTVPDASAPLAAMHQHQLWLICTDMVVQWVIVTSSRWASTGVPSSKQTPAVCRVAQMKRAITLHATDPYNH